LRNVAGGISAGVAAVVSGVPILHRYTLTLCLLVVAILTIVNLRGVRESGLTFQWPMFAFVACIAAAIVIGVFRVWQSGGSPQPIASPTPIREASLAVSAWLLLRAFVTSCSAMIGVEAVSNGVRLFGKPKVHIARPSL